jgi:SAM-dependent methyltransferase
MQELPGNPGYLHALFRALDSMGWVDRVGTLGSPELEIRWTRTGRSAVREAACLEVVPELLEKALDLAEGIEGELHAPAAGPLESWLAGHQIGPLMLGCLLRPEAPVPESMRWPLEALGWMEGGAWTEEGRIARLQSGIYHYPVSYLATLMRVEELLFGDPTALRQRSETGEESHVDRRRDILFSGQVFSGSVAAVLWDHFLPLLASSSPPRTVVDVGCGDGLMLRELGQRAPGARLVGVEYNPVAREVAEETLRDSPGALAVLGDMGDPEGIAATLESHAIDLDSVLWVTKSVIHNRPYRAPGRSGRPARTTTACATPDGLPIPGGDLEENLVEFFQSWKPYLGKHGFLVVEAHTVPPEVARTHLGRTIAPVLDYTHALSGQLLIEADIYRDCAREAGLRSLSQSEIGAAAFGHNHMTVDHFVA